MQISFAIQFEDTNELDGSSTIPEVLAELYLRYRHLETSSDGQRLVRLKLEDGPILDLTDRDELMLAAMRLFWRYSSPSRRKLTLPIEHIQIGDTTIEEASKFVLQITDDSVF